MVLESFDLVILEISREGIASQSLGERPEDIAYQSAWNLYHAIKGNPPVYPKHFRLMQKLGYINSANELTEKGRDLYTNLDQQKYYEELCE